MSYLFAFTLIITAGVFGFGGSVRAQVFFEDGFESGDLTYEENGTRWTASNSGQSDYVIVSSERAHSGNYSLKFFFAGNSNLNDDAWAEQRFILGQTQTELFMRFYIYFPSNYKIRITGGSNNTKFFNIWGTTYSDPMTIDMEIEATNDAYMKAPKAGYPSYLTCSGSVGVVPGLSPWTLNIDNLGRWNCFEVHLKRDSGAGDGEIQLWIDGDIVIDGTNLSWVGAPCSPGYFLNGYLMGWSNSGFDEDTSIYIDNVVFSGSYIGPIDTPDITPPSRSNPQPTGTLSSGTTSTTISLDTNETATCKYSTSSGINYDSMANTFSNTNSTTHFTTVSDLSDGETRSYYIRCQDEQGNANSDDFPISFSVGLFPQGDVTGDDSVDITDVQACVNHILATQDWGEAADVNKDGSVNVLDVQEIVNVILGP